MPEYSGILILLFIFAIVSDFGNIPLMANEYGCLMDAIISPLRVPTIEMVTKMTIILAPIAPNI